MRSVSICLALVLVALVGCVPPKDADKPAEAKPASKPVAAKPKQEKPKPTVLNAETDKFTLGDWRLKVLEVKVGELKTVNRYTKQVDVYDEHMTQVFLQVGNMHQTRRKTYRTFYDGGPSNLVDEHGNGYGRLYPGLGWQFSFRRHNDKVIASVDKKEAVDPGIGVVDVIVFSRPVEPAKTLILTLSQDNLGGKGSIVFSIPERMFRSSK